MRRFCKPVFTFLIIPFSYFLFSQAPFITTWKTDNPGVSCNTCIKIPTYPGETYIYSVDWNNDGVYDQTGITGSVTHNFGTAGTYTIRITGTFPRIYFNYGGDKLKIINIDLWGDIAWSSMANSFFGCNNLNCNATDAPNLSNVTDLSWMFADCPAFNANLNNWNTSNISNMSAMFYYDSQFNQQIGNWDVSNVSNFEAIFMGANSFNQNISNWNTSAANDMSLMFYEAYSFNQNIGNWDVSNVGDMGAMFLEAISFNQNISNWNVSSVATMWGMFQYATSFNQNIGNWNISNVSYGPQMFAGASSFNQNLGNWLFNNNADLAFFFEECGMDCSNYSLTLSGWANNPLTPSNRSLGASGRQYGPAAVSARNYLINNKGWTISGDTYNSSCVVVLPLSLLDFSVQKQPNNNITLSWQTENENLVSHFTIQRSSDADNADKWEDIGEIEAKNEVSGTNSFNFIDDQPLKGINYYRLRINDQDGNFEYSPVRSVYFGEDNAFEAYGSDRTITIINNTRSKIHYLVYNSIGRIVADTYDTEIPVPQSGIYLVSDGVSARKVYIR